MDPTTSFNFPENIKNEDQCVNLKFVLTVDLVQKCSLKKV